MPLEEPVPELRHVSDAQTMRALSHPVRFALIEELTLSGRAMTATELGEVIGETATTCSFHLRQLAKYGFVEEAGGGRGRARPWRMTSIGINVHASGGDPDSEIAQAVLGRMLRDRTLGRYRTWLETKQSYPRPWQDAAGETDWIAYLTADELDRLQGDILALLLSRHRERLEDPSLRPPGSVPVEVLVLSYPMRHPGPDGAD